VKRRAELLAVAALTATLLFGAPVRADTPVPPTSLWQEGPRNTAVPNGFDLAFDTTRAVVVLAQATGLYGYDGATWKALPATALPPLVATSALAYDEKRSRLVRYDNNRETWEWDGATWRGVATNGPDLTPGDPSVRLVYDDARGHVLAVGAGALSPLLAVWEWDGAAWAAHASSTKAPSRRTNFALAYDRARKKAVMFGGVVDPLGNGVGAVTDETWEWDGAAWEMRMLTPGPSARIASMAYDIARKRTILFAGKPAFNGGAPLNDTWEYDGTQWSEVHPASAPPPRFAGAMVYDSRRRRTVLFGGGSITPANDTWDYSTVGGTCASDADCDTSRCDVGVCCSVTCGPCGRCDANGTGCLSVRSADDPDTCTGASTCDANARCRWKAGHACGLGSECASQECTNAICCGSLCAPFACNESGACKASCASDVDCAASARCVDNACKVPSETCETASVSRAASGARQACSPYACDPRLGTCRVACASSEECDDGFSCTAGGTCASVPSSQGGCAVSVESSSATVRWSALVASLGAALLVARRRRRR
jgi:MYXO-CTERM domain-containing protein